MANLTKIRELSKERGIPLKELAELLNISENGLQRIIKSNSTRIETLEKIADILNVPISVFFQDYKPSLPVELTEFISNKIVKLTLNRFDKISDKLDYMKDVFIWEVTYKIENNLIPSYPFVIPYKPENLLNTEEEIRFFNLLSSDIPFSRMSKREKKILQGYTTLFEGFYFPVFYLNLFKINFYLNDGFIQDKEIIQYWDAWNKIKDKIEDNKWCFITG